MVWYELKKKTSKSVHPVVFVEWFWNYEVIFHMCILTEKNTIRNSRKGLGKMTDNLKILGSLEDGNKVSVVETICSYF